MSVKRVLFVCMGNICRSPTAEAVFRKLVAEAGLEDEIVADSAGTIGHNTGHPPDDSAQAHAKRRGYDLSRLRGRQVKPADFSQFDLVIAMDRTNVAALMRLCPQEHRHKLRLLMEYAPALGVQEIPDPYGGEEAGFEKVLDLVEAAARGLLLALRPTESGRA